MSEPALPYGHQSVDEDDIEAVVAVLRSDWLTTGPLVGQFEAALAAAACTDLAVAVSSGTAALHCAYAALGIGPGSSLVTSPLTFAATATAALHLGGRVIFCDVSPESGNLDPAAASAALAPDTVAVVPTDYAGHPSDYAALRQLADARGISILSDAAHSFGARFGGRPITQLVDAAALSFHPVKAITTAEGGALVTSAADWAARARAFRNHGIARDPSTWRHAGGEAHYYEVQSLGLNYRLPDVLCALGLSQLGRLDGFLARRRAIAHRYTEAFSGLAALETPATATNCDPAWHLYVLRVRETSRRDAMFEGLRASGLGVQVHYPPVHTHPLFEDLGMRAGQFPVAEDFASRAISIPIFPAMRDADVDRVIDAVAAAAREWL